MRKHTSYLSYLWQTNMLSAWSQDSFCWFFFPKIQGGLVNGPGDSVSTSLIVNSYYKRHTDSWLCELVEYQSMSVFRMVFQRFVRSIVYTWRQSEPKNQVWPLGKMASWQIRLFAWKGSWVWRCPEIAYVTLIDVFVLDLAAIGHGIKGLIMIYYISAETQNSHIWFVNVSNHSAYLDIL